MNGLAQQTQTCKAQAAHTHTLTNKTAISCVAFAHAQRCFTWFA